MEGGIADCSLLCGDHAALLPHLPSQATAVCSSCSPCSDPASYLIPLTSCKPAHSRKWTFYMWLFVYVQQGWQIAGSKHCMTVNGRDLHSVCKPQPCLKYCRCQSCTSWDLYPKSPFYSHGKALQIFFLLQS